jgi:5-methylcytosine-specific restriction enzyme A
MCAARGTTRPAHHVDHITPISKGGAWFDSENLESLCASCHSVKTLGDKGHAVRMGAGLDGTPIDPSHPWNARGRGGSDAVE